ncbi:MAG: diguanylate cyclase [Lachnospiraceae bacterium]|nr:diguanylate cyclase [Lachnospiraceae bacterium]
MKKILIVDDDNMNCILAKHALVQEYELAMAYSGTEALEYLEEELPDLILMDIEMPEMDGKEAAKRIKEKDEWKSIPIVFLTADSNPMTEAECLSFGADDFITKPFVPDVMRSRVGKILDAHEKRKDLETLLEQNTQKSLTDALTGLNNRPFLEKKLGELINDDRSGTLFMIDLDNFKKMNDTYGHMVGDEVLKTFAEVLKMFARKDDILCRLGGDEFVTFYTDLTDREIVAQKATDIIRIFSDKMGAMGYGGIVSVSIGAKITLGEESFEELYDRADKTLYLVKNGGKNAYRIYDENIDESADKISQINTNATLERIHNMMMQDMAENKGAFHVEYNEFKKMYDFAMRCVIRNRRKVQIVLFTIEAPEEVQEKAMDVFIQSVISSLRNVDTGTQYSSTQYVLIIMDADLADGREVAGRVIGRFHEINNGVLEDCRITFDIETMRPSKGK